MAWLFADGFDWYATAADMTAGKWDSYGTAPILTATSRFSTGKALTHSAGSTNLTLTKAWGSNDTVFLLAVSYMFSAMGSNTQGIFFTFRDGTTAQVTVQLAMDGNIYVRGGNSAASIIATYSAALSISTWYQFQIKVTINNTTGRVQIRKNGATSDDYDSTAVLNTRNGTTNAYANSLQIVTAAPSSPTWYFDDLLLISCSGAAPNDWVGDVRSIQLMPTADTAQKDFVRSPATGVIGAPGTTSTTSVLANTVFWNANATVAPAGTTTLAKITVNFNAGFTGNAKCAVYTDAGGTPDTLVTNGTSNQVTNPGSGVVDFTMGTPPTLIPGASYWFAILTDAACTPKSGASGAAKKQSQTYGSGFPSPASTTADNHGQFASGTVNLDNQSAVNEAANDGDTSFVGSSTVNAMDIYDIANLTVTPTTIVGVVAKQYVKKSDAGARSGGMRVISGASDAVYASAALNSTYTWQEYVFAQNPDGPVDWSAATVNALKIGPKVTA